MSFWDLDLNLVLNPTSSRAILIGDAAHSIHPLAGQGLNLSLRDCSSALNAIENCLKFGNDLGDKTILKENVCFHMIAVMQFGDWGVESSESIRVIQNGAENFYKFPSDLHIKG